jgi:hypothetical protein
MLHSRFKLAWHLVEGGIVGPPLPPTGTCRHRPSAHVALERLYSVHGNYKIKFQTYVYIYLKLLLTTRTTSSDLCLRTQLAMLWPQHTTPESGTILQSGQVNGTSPTPTVSYAYQQSPPKRVRQHSRFSIIPFGRITRHSNLE